MATLLPNGKQQFIDANGNPLASGSVSFYIPSTTTPKDTWQDSGATILNTNPIILDASGEAIIYGSGVYRQVVYDSAGNLIWDQITADTAVGGIAFGGVSTGTPNAQVIAASSFSQQDGQVVDFIAGATNSGPLTINLGGGPIPLLQDTPIGPAPLSGGEVVAANAVSMLYEASRGAFHLLTPSANIVGLGQAYTAQTAVTPASIKLAEAINNGANTVTITIPAAVTSNRTFTIPDATGSPALLELADQVITGGARVTPDTSRGTITTGTVTLDPGDRPLQAYTNGGAHTLAPGANNGYLLLDITNNASAGAITTSGWTKVVGVFTTTSGHKFRCGCSISTAGSLLTIQAMQ